MSIVDDYRIGDKKKYFEPVSANCVRDCDDGSLWIWNMKEQAYVPLNVEQLEGCLWVRKFDS